jgi:hypothetical protein
MPEASELFWYFDQARVRHGPLAEADVVRLINERTIGPDSMIWYSGLPDWRPAGQVEKFATLFAGRMPPPPPAPAFAPTTRGAISPAGGLIATLPVWGLFGRCLLLTIGSLLVIPAPWTGTAFYRYVGTHIALPDGRRLTFSGQAGDIWLVFVGVSILGLAGLVIPYGNLLAMPFSWALVVVIIRWFCAKLGSEDGSVKLAFNGGIWNYIGWSLLLNLSFFTIIGWAWALRLMMRWICQNVSGTVRFDFHGTGLAILGRTLLLCLLSIFIIPIPWLTRWYMVWFISQIKAQPAGA